MNPEEIKPCFSAPEIMPEQFIPDHVFVYVTKGAVSGYDGNKSYKFKTGDYCLVRKNRLARYNTEKGRDEFEKITFCLEEKFLRDFQEKHQVKATKFMSGETFVTVIRNERVDDFIRSLAPYMDGSGKIEAAFEALKSEELLMILLKDQPELAGIFFDYGIPAKINLEEFMSRNYKFNVNLKRFAYLTGRSLSAFKRDFKTTFNQTPSRWLVKRRLEEAYFLLDKMNAKATEIYLDLGFEDLSHFSLAFKKHFGFRPIELKKQNQKTVF